MARPRDERLRERLIAAATDEFASLGYAGATLDGIAARAGVTKGGVYFHFAGKEELFFAALDHWRQVRRRRLQAPLPQGDAAAALREFVVSYLRFHFEAPAPTHLQRILATELRGRLTSTLREDDRQEQRWLRATLRDVLVRGLQDGSLLVTDPPAAAFVLAATLTGILEHWQTASNDVAAFCDPEQLARGLCAPLLSGRSGGASLPSSEFDYRDTKGDG